MLLSTAHESCRSACPRRVPDLPDHLRTTSGFHVRLQCTSPATTASPSRPAFYRHAKFQSFGEHRVQDRVRDLVRNLVGVAHRHRLGRELVPVAHRIDLPHQADLWPPRCVVLLCFPVHPIIG